MAAEIKVEIQGSKQTRDKLGRFSSIIDDEARSALKEIADFSTQHARANAPVDLGGLKRSIHTEPVQIGGSIVSFATVTRRPYALVQEEGRKAGSRPPSTGHIAGWMNRHFVSSNPKRTAFVLAQSIGRKGFRGKHFMAWASVNAEYMAKRRFATASTRITKWWDANI